MALRLHNTLTRQKEEFVPLAPPRVTYYNCGPTVYDAFTIGNARNFIVADVLRRWLRSSGYKVQFVQNLTDVDDKIINKANEEGRSAAEVADHYAEVYFQYADALGIERADNHPRCTRYMPQMIAAIEALITKGHAYESGGDVFFSVASYPGYGRLSGKNLDDMEEAGRVAEEVAGRKRAPADFALWKGAKPGEPSWESPWGPGRPGWHIECSAMSMDLLGQTIDIHSGGEDLTFPHHENEIAQSCCLSGKEFARYWVHNGFLNFGDKISKSTMTAETREIFMIDKALARFKPEAIRYFLLTAHYRSQLQFSMEALADAQSRCDKIREACEATRQLIQTGKTLAFDMSGAARVNKIIDRYREAMDDDLNTPQALAALAELVTRMNALRAEIDRGGAVTAAEKNMELSHLYQAAGNFLEVLGLKQFLHDKPKAAEGASTGKSEQILQALVAARTWARAEKQWAFTDALRDDLAKLGVSIKDGSSGATWNAEGSLPPEADLAKLALNVLAKAEGAAAKALGASLEKLGIS